MNRQTRPTTVILLVLVILLPLCCLLGCGIAAFALYSNLEREALSAKPPQSGSQPWQTPTREPLRETAAQPTGQPSGEPVASPTPEAGSGAPLSPTSVPTSASTAVSSETLLTLESAEVPFNDPLDLAKRLENKQNLAAQLEFQVTSHAEGDRESFWVTNTETNESSQVMAALVYISEHVYFWVEEGVRYQERHVKALVDTFEDKIYPTNREFFGSEWTPGVDADPHIYILYARSLGGPVAGYFSSADEYLPTVREYSNGHEMFLLSARHLDLNEEYTYGVLAHEFQHMIHWYRDRNEESWMNEGASDLASFLNGYSIGGHDRVFASNPDIQLNDWPSDSTDNTEHYGASFLFLAYFLDRFGEDATKALVADQANGLSSIDRVLSDLGIKDPLNGQPITADDFFMDWQITNYLQDEDVADGRYTYHNYPAAPNFQPTHEVSDCPLDTFTSQVSQYGINALQIDCQGDYVFHFEGATQVGILPEDPRSESHAFFSNRGDESHMSLSREFDFSAAAGSLTLSYWTWYDLEQDFDYVYLTASTDGEQWQILTTPSGTPEDPSGNSYGWGYNGKSGAGPAWIREEVDISQFAGQKVWLRFEYVTDTAVNGEGFWVDDISVEEAGYFADFELDDGGWQARGFVRIQNTLPQTFRLAVIRSGRNTTVETYPVEAGNRVDIPLHLGGDTRDVIILISGTSRYTRQKATYSFSIQPE